MKILLKLFAALLLLLAFQDRSGAQTPTIKSHVFMRPSCSPGWSYGIDWEVRADTCLAINLENSYSNGFKDTCAFAGNTMNCAAWNHYPWLKFTTPGEYTIKHVILSNTWQRVDSIEKKVVIGCALAGGVIYLDSNNNCKYDGQEATIAGTFSIVVDSENVAIDTLTSYRSWVYEMKAGVPTNYQFRLISAPAAYTLSCPSNGVITHQYHPDSASVYEQSFGFHCSPTPSRDYVLSCFRALRGASSGGASYFGVYAANNSCYSGNGTVTLQISPKYTINVSKITPAPISVSGQTVVWNLFNMADGKIQQLFVPLTPLPSTSDGDTACNYAVIAPLVGDAFPANNVFQVCDSVRSSWDPNAMSVTPNGIVNPGSILTYTIDFENFGGDTAFNIHVLDTLSRHVDVTSFKLLDASHRVVPYLYPRPDSGYIIKFDFPDIKLAEKSRPTHNKGQVRYSIKLKNGLNNGTQIQNRAGIYFDRNVVVMTNSAFNRTPGSVGIEALSGNTTGVIIYPNPVTDAVHVVVSSDWKEAVLYNTMGHLIKRQPLLVGANSISLQDQPVGLYYLRITGNKNAHTKCIQKR